jgi:hypothetical protein
MAQKDPKNVENENKLPHTIGRIVELSTGPALTCDQH